MGRWEPDAAGRLRTAAMQLYLERGFDQTTVAEIAERAGLTARTFFRYFADKREVIFGGSAELERAMVAAVEQAPPEASALAVVAAALDAAADMIGERREFSRQRYAVINSHAELRERELAKMAGLAAAVAGALQARGIAQGPASIAAETGIGVFRVAFERWLELPGSPALGAVIAESLDELRALL